MTVEFANPSAAEHTDGDQRKAWIPPVIEDADISAITDGTGTSGIEGTPFLKPGS